MSKSTDDLSSTCPLCYQDITIFAIGACDHTICHVCSTRMRALCNQLYCPVCRTDLPQVVFTTKHHQYSGIITHRFPRDRDAKISFENNRVRLQYNKLLAHQCSLCEGRLAEGNFKMLQDHMRKEHELFYCDLCADYLKIFTSERKSYTRKDLAQHRRKGDKDDTSYKGHPLCEFCDKRYFDKDELLKHLRRDHYFCHFCDSTGISNQYYNDYDNLKVHFRESHFLCEQGDCEFEQFSHAFASDIDLKAHKASVHSGSFSKFQARQNRQIDVEINLPPRPRDQRGRVGGHGVGRGRAHLLHADDEDMQRALEASIHTARADDDKPEKSREQTKRGKNRKVPELEYTDVRNDPYYYKRRPQEKQHAKPAAEKREVPQPKDFPNLLDRKAENRSPLMSASWVKPQTQGPDFPELNPSSATAPPRPQSYPGPRQQSGRRHDTREDYPVLGGRSGPGANRADPPGSYSSQSKQSHTGRKPDPAEDYPALGGRNEPRANRADPRTNKSQSKQSYTGRKPDLVEDYPALGGKNGPGGEPADSPANVYNNHGNQSPKMPSKREQKNRARPKTAAIEVQTSRASGASSFPQKQSGKGKKNQKIESLSEYPVLGAKGEPDRNHQASFKDPLSESRMGGDRYEVSTKPSSKSQQPSSYQGATKLRPGRVDDLSEYPSLGGGASAPLVHQAASNQGVYSNGPSTQRDQEDWFRPRSDSSRANPPRTTPSMGDPSYSASTPEPEVTPEDFPSLSSIATLLSNDKKGVSKKKDTPKPIESKKPQKPAESKRRPQQTESKRPVKADVGPASSTTEWEEEATPTQAVEVKPPISKAPPGFVNPPPPGFSPGPPPGFGSVPVHDVGYVSPPPTMAMGDVNYLQPEDYKDRNKELVRKIKKCLKDRTGGFDEFRTLSGQYRTGILSAYGYYDRCLSLLGSNFKGIFDELVSLLPDVDKQQELLRVQRQRERESSDNADASAPSAAVLKISSRSSAAPWREGEQKRHKVCPLCQQMVLSRDYDSHLNNHQDFPALGSAAPVQTNPGQRSAWGRRK